MAVQAQMDLTDRRLLNLIQAAFPLVGEPFQDLGNQLGISGSDTIERIRALKKTRVIRQISAIFDTRRLGYRSTLVAMRFPPETLDQSARIINQHPGVSHNYARNHSFNLWFTLAVPPSESLESTIQDLAERTGAETFRMMPTLRLFKIGVNFDMVHNESAAHSYNIPSGPVSTDGEESREAEPLIGLEVSAVRELQEDLSLIPRPFDAMSNRLGMTTPELLEMAHSFQNRGIMRRFSAVLHHRNSGFRANAMTVWNVPPERSEEVGRIMASSPWVTHCYERPTFPDWPYSHFSMVHGSTKKECQAAVKDLADQTGIADYMPLYSTREYKKTRVRYFA